MTALAQLLISEMSLNLCYMPERYANALWLPGVTLKKCKI